MPNRYTNLHTSWMQVKIASFPAASGLVPVLTTTPNIATLTPRVLPAWPQDRITGDKSAFLV